MANISNDGSTAEEVDNLSNSELFSFMSIRKSDFITIAGVIKAREESAKAESLKDLSASISELKDKNGSLEKELLALEGDLADRKKDCMALREKEKLDQEKIKVLMEEVRKEREESANRKAKDEVIALKQKYLEIEQMETDLKLDFVYYGQLCLMLKEKLTSLKSKYLALKVLEENTNTRCKLLEDVQLNLENARNNRIAEFYSCKDDCSSTGTWIQQFLENNPDLMDKGVREQAKNGDKQNANFTSSNKKPSKRKLLEGSNIPS